MTSWLAGQNLKPNKMDSAACGSKSQTCKTGVGAKGKTFSQVPGPGRMVDSHPKDHVAYLLKLLVLIEIERGGFSFSF